MVEKDKASWFYNPWDFALTAAQAHTMLWKKRYDDKTPAQLQAELERYGRVALANEVTDIMQRYLPIPEDPNRALPKVLDLAAGVGVVSGVLDSRGFSVTATDLDETGSFLAHIKGRYPDVTTQQLDMNEDFLLPSESFDGITTVWSNRYIQDPKTFLTRTKQLLKPGGIFVWPIFDEEASPWRSFSRNSRQITDRDTLGRVALDVGYGKVDSFDGNRIPPFHVKARYLVLTR